MGGEEAVWGRVVKDIGHVARVQVHISPNIEREQSGRPGIGSKHRTEIGMERRGHLLINEKKLCFNVCDKIPLYGLKTILLLPLKIL